MTQDMPVLARSLLLLAAVAAASMAFAAQARRSATGPRPPVREGSLRFAQGVHPTDAQVIRDAIAQARPEARRLIDRVDGAVTVIVGQARPGAAGTTLGGRDGFLVTLDLGGVSRTLGPRGITRLILHELGHVVDEALLPDALRAQLDATIPAGLPCAAAGDASCAGRSAREERFAETFAKWATGDIGVGLEIGYRVLPPASLDDWGAPLAAL